MQILCIKSAFTFAIFYRAFMGACIYTNGRIHCHLFIYSIDFSSIYINILPNESDQVHFRDAFMFKQGILIHFDILIKKNERFA